MKQFHIKFFAIACVCLLAIAAFAFIANEMVLEKEDFFDAKVFNALSHYISPINTRTALTITFFGSIYFLLPAYIVLATSFFVWKKNRTAIVIIVIALTSLLLGLLLKEIFQRQRPLLPFLSPASGYSFPSGHSLGGFTFNGLLIYLVWQTTARHVFKWLLTLMLILFACLIGLSRVYLHVHFASDVIGSLCVTLVWLPVCFSTLHFLEKRKLSYP